MEILTKNELKKLVRSVFPPISSDKVLDILLDFPKEKGEDHDDWQQRRNIAQEWFKALQKMQKQLGLRVRLVVYPNVGSNNADLPENGYVLKEPMPNSLEAIINQAECTILAKVFEETDIVIALTQFSATAPLKLAAKAYHFRAATMPGFSTEMIPALKIDYNLVNKRVEKLKRLLDSAHGANVRFIVDDEKPCDIYFDLRHRTAHASGGRFPSRGMAGNLPSGEAYIVPYEGEADSESLTEGVLPVQFDQDIVYYRIERNRARETSGNNKSAISENLYLKKEPAYGNMAELGFGVLYDFGLKAINEILLDEKLGFHIAFGRSDHFNGFVGPQQFSSPTKVVHVDRIYLPEIQPRIKTASVELEMVRDSLQLIKHGRYTIF